MKKIREEMKKDVNKYIRQSKKLDGKSFKKTYVKDENISFRLELNGSERKISMLLKGNTLGKTTIGDISNFDSTWDSFIQEIDRFMSKMLEVYRDSFNEKMDEIIETDELFKPFTVKNKEDHSLDFEIDLTREGEGDLVVMCNLGEGIYEDGLMKGKQEGWEKGRKEGRKEGRREGKLELALEMLKDGMALEKVAKYSKLSLSIIKELAKQNKLI